MNFISPILYPLNSAFSNTRGGIAGNAAAKSGADAAFFRAVSSSKEMGFFSIRLPATASNNRSTPLTSPSEMLAFNVVALVQTKPDTKLLYTANSRDDRESSSVLTL